MPKSKNKRHTYKVEITEYLRRTVVVDAEDEEDAKSKVEDMYYNEDIVLSADDFDYMEMKVLNR